jgi:hypothetical protein
VVEAGSNYVALSSCSLWRCCFPISCPRHIICKTDILLSRFLVEENSLGSQGSRNARCFEVCWRPLWPSHKLFSTQTLIIAQLERFPGESNKLPQGVCWFCVSGVILSLVNPRARRSQKRPLKTNHLFSPALCHGCSF